VSISGRWAAGTAAAARTNDAATYRTTRLGAFACGRLRESTRRCADSSREPDGGTRQRCDFFAAQGRWAASGSTGTQRRDERETQREERERGLQTAGGRGNTGSATTEVVGPVGDWQVVGGVWGLLPWRWWRRIGGARTRCLQPWPQYHHCRRRRCSSCCCSSRRRVPPSLSLLAARCCHRELSLLACAVIESGYSRSCLVVVITHARSLAPLALFALVRRSSSSSRKCHRRRGSGGACGRGLVVEILVPLPDYS